MFSVIIPVYNGEKFIENAINSVFSQTYSDFELIIVNDGSRDNTAAVLEKYADNSKITVIPQKNGGVSVARNNGISNARGSHLVFLDADDVWEPFHLETMANLIEKYPTAGLYGTFTRTELVNGNIISECNFFRDKEENDIFLDDFFAAYHKDKSAKMFTVITTCISAEAMKKAGGFPEGCAIGEDLELSLRVAAYYPVVLSKIITATYKKENSVATKDKSFDPDWKFFDTVEELYSDITIPPSKKTNIRKVMGWFTMRRCRHYMIDGERRKAYQAYINTPKESVSLKDRLINLVLLMLPASMVRKIFAARWRGQA